MVVGSKCPRVTKEVHRRAGLANQVSDSEESKSFPIKQLINFIASIGENICFLR